MHEVDQCETWEAWNTIRSMCNYSPRLSVSAFAVRAPFHRPAP